MDKLPFIATELDIDKEHPHYPYYLKLIPLVLKNIIPPYFFRLCQEHPQNHEMLQAQFKSLLPLVSYSTLKTPPTNVSFFALFNYRQNAFKFFFEMISRWLVPGKRLNVVLVHAVDFVFPELSQDKYTVCEVVISVENQQDLEILQRHLPTIEAEVRLGIVSGYHAHRLLEIKGLTYDEKTALIQEHIGWLASHWKENFSSDVFTEMQHLLVMCRDDFKAAREMRHLSRVIIIQYLFRKDLFAKIKEEPKKRHLRVKIFQARIRHINEQKKVLGIIIAINFLESKEILEEGHLVQAVQAYIPEVKAVEQSFLFSRRAREPLGTFYFEIEKTNHDMFSAAEIALLRKELPFDLGGRIERLMHPVFMPRNEEEVMRNILTLSDQIKYVHDIPQMFISFEEQTRNHLYFTVILVRVVKDKSSFSVEELFKKGSSLQYFHDRTKLVAPFRKKYAKEATVFRLRVAKKLFLRPDSSIDLNKARQVVSQEVNRVIGEVRDYNGGMISKQNELLDQVKDLLQGGVKNNEVLLENLFYSMHPVAMRSILEADAFKKLFLMLLECVGNRGFLKEEGLIQVRAEPAFVYVILCLESFAMKKEIEYALKQLKLPSFSLATTVVSVDAVYYAGYIFRSNDPLKQRKFCQTVQHAMQQSQTMQ